MWLPFLSSDVKTAPKSPLLMAELHPFLLNLLTTWNFSWLRLSQATWWYQYPVIDESGIHICNGWGAVYSSWSACLHPVCQHLKDDTSRGVAVRLYFLRTEQLWAWSWYGGHLCGTWDAIVVRRTESKIFHVKARFRHEKLSATFVEEKVNRNGAWYGNMDGNYCRQAILLVIDTIPACSNFLWTVTVGRSGLSMERYRPPSRWQETKNSPLFYVEFTFADFLCNWSMECDR